MVLEQYEKLISLGYKLNKLDMDTVKEPYYHNLYKNFSTAYLMKIRLELEVQENFSLRLASKAIIDILQDRMYQYRKVEEMNHA